MSYQARGFQISILLHSLIILLVVFSSSFMGQYKKVIAISFDLYNPVSKTEDSQLQAAPPVIKTKPVAAAVIKKSERKELPVPPAEKPRVLPVSEVPPAVELPVANKLDTQTMAIGKSDTSATVRDGYSGVATEQNERSNTTGIAYTAGAGKAAKIKYLNDHFAYIRDKILRNVSYPDAARRMGWQGKVVLSFIITANGYVRDFNVIQSSGFKMLDNKAIEAVKETAPFPRPPDEAYIVIPITYRLQ
jgi:protein TonB